MNFLAHVFLSGDDFPLAVGNLIADQIKGNEVQNYPLQVQNGIKLHHAIDHFTDTHQIFKECVTELFPIYRHFSRVIIDMDFDHFLAVHWNKYHSLHSCLRRPPAAPENSTQAFADMKSVYLGMFSCVSKCTYFARMMYQKP